MTKQDQGHFALPPARHDELHDDIALALDAISGRPSERNLAEAASYLRHALRLAVLHRRTNAARPKRPMIVIRATSSSSSRMAVFSPFRQRLWKR